MITKYISAFSIALLSVLPGQTQELPGAGIPWTTDEAEQMRTTYLSPGKRVVH